MKLTATGKPIRHTQLPARTTVLLEILALGNRQIAAGKVVPAKDLMRSLRERKAAR